MAAGKEMLTGRTEGDGITYRPLRGVLRCLLSPCLHYFCLSYQLSKGRLCSYQFQTDGQRRSAAR